MSVRRGEIILSIVVPVFNEKDSIEVFVRKILPILESVNVCYEIIFVDDGSTDNTSAVVLKVAKLDPQVRLIRLTRNFGKEAALTAGLDAATGAAVIPIDVDLQDPPELIPQFVELWEKGYDVVYGLRSDRTDDSPVKRGTSHLFYWLFNRISAVKLEPDVGDFRLMSRRAVEATLLLREKNRFMKGIFSWVGFRAVGVPYRRTARQYGVTKFTYWKLWNFAIDGITGFSTVPLRVWTYVGLSVAGSAFVYIMIIFSQILTSGVRVPGYASLMVVVLVLGATQLISLGFIGEYLGRLYIEAKCRPLYVVDEEESYSKERRSHFKTTCEIKDANIPISFHQKT